MGIQIKLQWSLDANFRNVVIWLTKLSAKDGFDQINLQAINADNYVQVVELKVGHHTRTKYGVTLIYLQNTPGVISKYFQNTPITWLIPMITVENGDKDKHLWLFFRLQALIVTCQRFT